MHCRRSAEGPARVVRASASRTIQEIPNAISDVLRGGIAWRLIPEDLPQRLTTFGEVSRWRDDGLFGRINHHRVTTDREWVGRQASPSAVVPDKVMVQPSRCMGTPNAILSADSTTST